MAPGKKNLKATKKFEKKHLKGVLEKRNAGAKIKQRQQIKAKKQARKARDAEFYKGEDGAPKTNGKKAKAAEMSVDDFFQGGFDEIIDKKRKHDKVSDDEVAEPASGDSDSEEDEELHGMSKETMAQLAEKDPEFYKALQEEDPEALEFDEDMDLGDLGDLEVSSGEESQPSKKRKTDDEPAQDNELTKRTVAAWRTAMEEKKSLQAAKQVVLAFRCAAHHNEDDADLRWSINDSDVYNDIVILALKEIPSVMNHHLPIKESASGHVYVSTESPKFKKLAALLKSYTSSLMHLVGTLSDDKTLKLTLSSMTPILPYLLPFKKLVKALCKAVVGFWAQPASSETTRVTAFLVLRRLVSIGDKSIREMALKAVYQGLVSGCRVTNHNTIQGINLMKNSAAELWGIDASVGYTTAFTFIRQLAIHLRNSIVNNKNDAFRMVYNWQFTHSLDFWSRVLAEHCNPTREAESGSSQLRLLIYPLVQVTLGAVRLVPTALYFPLRFHLVRSLLRTSRATGTYIPLASILLEVLSSAEMKKAPKATTLKAFDFAVAYKAPKSYLRTRVYQDGVGEQMMELLADFFMLWSTSIAFPELALPVVIQLKRWLKQSRGKSGNRNAKLAGQIVLLVQKIEANAKFIEEKRAKVDFAPKDRAQVDAFLADFDVAKTPLGAYVVAQRQAREEKAKMMEDARKDEDRKRREDEAPAAAEESEEESDVDLAEGSESE